MKLRFLDLFSGIGGFSLGFQQAGFNFKTHYYSEVDKYAIQIYEKHFPTAHAIGDITKAQLNERLDILTGGFPCQAFSIAGHRRGFEDTRGTLFFEICRLAQRCRPSYMVLENVKGLRSHDKGNTLRKILDSLRGLDYYVQTLLLNSKDFGIPQNRERLFFICSARGKPRPEISGLRERKTVDNHGQRTCIQTGTLRTHNDGRGFRRLKSNLCPTIPARARNDGSGQPVIAILENSTIRRLTPVECERLQAFPDNWTSGLSDTQRYKTLGNAVTVEVVKQIALTIKEALNA